MSRVNRRVGRMIAGLVAGVFLLAACSSSPALTEAQVGWCLDNHDTVTEAQERLNLKDYYRVWGEKRGVEYDEDGNELPMSDAVNEVVLAEITELGVSGDVVDSLYALWMEHPDGVQSCQAAYDSQ